MFEFATSEKLVKISIISAAAGNEVFPGMNGKSAGCGLQAGLFPIGRPYRKAVQISHVLRVGTAIHASCELKRFWKVAMSFSR